MRNALANQDMDAIWTAHNPNKRTTPRPACSQSDCARAKARKVAS
jgi:hypothetical protein